MSSRRHPFSNEPIARDAGLLVIRLGVGLTMALMHGWGKITGGTELWGQLGGAMGNLGVAFAPVAFGFLAAFAEFFGGLLVAAGVAFRPAAAMLAFTMFVAVVTHLNMPPESPNAGWTGASHAFKLMVVYFGLILTGPGRFSFPAPKSH
ncbi:MAG: DoxX family protein [Gemmatimonadetes bacterium]|nr:DoxX family protein [Gemmatimonadota bacterium]